jgi:L-threonylcarbamoyladenylate synthase
MKEISTWPIEEVAGILTRGGVIAYPTETVYGLGVDALNESAIHRLFKIKTRASGKPISVLVKDMEMLARVASGVPAGAKSLMKKYWPGPVTIILPASKEIPSVLTGQTGTIAVRISPHPFVSRLFEVFASPLTSTSANISGMRSLTKPDEIVRTFYGLVDLVIILPGFMEGRESTLVDATGERPGVVRKGAIDIGNM